MIPGSILWAFSLNWSKISEGKCSADTSGDLSNGRLSCKRPRRRWSLEAECGDTIGGTPYWCSLASKSQLFRLLCTCTCLWSFLWVRGRLLTLLRSQTHQRQLHRHTVEKYPWTTSTLFILSVLTRNCISVRFFMCACIQASSSLSKSRQLIIIRTSLLTETLLLAD